MSTQSNKTFCKSDLTKTYLDTTATKHTSSAPYYRRVSMLALCASMTLMGISIKAHADYNFQEVPGTAQCWGINERNEAICVESSYTASLIYDIKKDSVTTEFIPLTGIGIANSGTIVGSQFDGFVTRGAIRNNKGEVTLFVHPNAVSKTQPGGINSRGMVTGYRDDASPQVIFSGFLYNVNKETFVDIVPSALTIPRGINAENEVVGSALFFDADSPCGTNQPFGTQNYGWLRTADGTVSFIEVNGQNTSLRGINDKGYVAGFILDDTFGNRKGFVIKLANTGETCRQITIDSSELLEFPGASRTFVQGINNQNVISGTALFDIPPFFLQVGFIATPE